jgi:hypothetical protein
VPKPKKAEARVVATGDKIANLLALLLVKDAPVMASIVTLTRAGFAPEEVALLLNTTTASVAQQNYAARRRKPVAKKPRKK